MDQRGTSRRTRCRKGHAVRFSAPDCPRRKDAAARGRHDHRHRDWFEPGPEEGRRMPARAARRGNSENRQSGDAVPQVRRPGADRDARRRRAIDLRRDRPGGREIQRMRSNRTLFGAAAAACLLLLAYGYYLQYFQDQDPCPLCLVQRGFYYACAVVFLAGAIHGSGAMAYSIAASVVALGGAGVAARQVWLQHLPAAQVPACGPDLFYMMP